MTSKLSMYSEFEDSDKSDLATLFLSLELQELLVFDPTGIACLYIAFCLLVAPAWKWNTADAKANNFNRMEFVLRTANPNQRVNALISILSGASYTSCKELRIAMCHKNRS